MTFDLRQLNQTKEPGGPGHRFARGGTSAGKGDTAVAIPRRSTPSVALRTGALSARLALNLAVGYTAGDNARAHSRG